MYIYVLSYICITISALHVRIAQFFKSDVKSIKFANAFKTRESKIIYRILLIEIYKIALD